MQPVQLKMARAALDLTIDQLASKMGLSHMEITRLEEGTDGDGRNVERVRTALQAEGIEWIGEDAVRFTGQPGGAALPVEELTTGNDGGVS